MDGTSLITSYGLVVCYFTCTVLSVMHAEVKHKVKEHNTDKRGISSESCLDD